MLAEVDDPSRRPRTLTLHYLRPPAAGACEVAVTVERAGRGLSTVSARLVQDGRDCILALAALGSDRPGSRAARPPGSRRARPGRPRRLDRIRWRVHRTSRSVTASTVRPALGSLPFAAGPTAETGGWIRTADDDPVDDVLLAAITDSWPPAVFSRLELPVGVPTVELTIHFRGAPSGQPGWCLVRFRTLEVSDGYLEESGEVWSADGRLLAESRQLAVVLAP